MMEEANMGPAANGQDERYRKRREKEDAHRGQLPGADDAALPPPVEPIRGEGEAKPKRNDPCPCGSGKKYKHCCGKK
jgi:preprotein translocase subunit SecA